MAKRTEEQQITWNIIRLVILAFALFCGLIGLVLWLLTK